MPKRHNRTKRGGGVWDSLSNFWEKAKNTVTGSQSYTQSTPSYTPSSPSYPQSTPSYTQPQPAAYPIGGRRRRRHTRKLRGGFKDNTPQTGIAAHAASFSGQTAQPHTWVGGRRRKKSHRKRHH